MKKFGITLLCITLLLGVFTACNKQDQTTSLPSLADVRDDAGEGNDTLPGEEDDGNGGADDVPGTEGAANVADNEVVATELDFKMAYPSDWSYLSNEELGLDNYVFAAGNRASGASIVVSQPLEAGSASLEAFADAMYGSFDETIAMYESMGITSELQPMENATLGGRDAKSIALQCKSSEAEFVQTTYIVESPSGEILTVMVSTYSSEDVTVAEKALASITWS